MNLNNIISLIGTVFSIVGAVIAIGYAKISKTEAKKIESVRNQIIEKRETSEITELNSACKGALNAMKKYGSGLSAADKVGVSFEKDIQVVQEFVFLITENREYFGKKSTNTADEFCSILNPIMDNFSQAKDDKERHKYGTDLCNHLSKMTSVIKSLLNKSREKYIKI